MWPIFSYLPLRPLRLDRLRLFAGRAVLVFLVARRIINSPFGLSLRGIRENSVRMPAIGAPSRAHLRKIYTISAVIAGHRRRAAGADHRDRLARGARLPALGRRAGDPDPRRRRPALWRPRRRDHLHGGARPVLRHQAAVLVFLDRPAADRGRDVPAERNPRRARAAHRVVARAVSRQAAAGAPRALLHARARQELRLAGRRAGTSRSTCRRARATR